MSKDDRNEKEAFQSGPGRFLFINKTSATLLRNPNESFVISSHVSKTHRRWLKEERLRRLLESKNKTVAQESILSADLYGPNAGPSTPTSRRTEAPAKTFTSQPLGRTNTFSTTFAHTVAGSNKSDVWKSNYSGPHLHHPGYPFEDSQDNDDQEHRFPAQRRSRPTRASSMISLSPFRGNSDPFSAAALPLATQDHDMIRLARQFIVFVANPDKRNAVWRAPIADSSSSRIRFPKTIEDEAEIHAILAAGYAVRSRQSGYHHTSSIARSLHHRTKAVELLRDRLIDSGFSQSVTTLIRLLISLDFEAANNEAALVHLRGLWAMAATTPGILIDAQELLRVSDAWISISLLKRPEISPLRYDPGERRRQWFADILIGLDRKHGVPAIDQPEEGTRVHSTFNRKTWGLLGAAQEIVSTKAIMDKIDDPNLLQEVIQWLNKRSTAVCGYCTTGYVDNSEMEAVPTTIDNHSITSTLMAAVCLCAMMLMNFRFLDMPTNYNFSKTCQSIEDTLRSVSKRLEHAKQKQPDKDYLWLLFLTSMGNDIFKARGDIPYSPWPVTEFHKVCERLKLAEPHEIVTALHLYPHYTQMDVFRTELLLHKAPVTNIVTWSKWQDILNHP